MNQFLNYLSRCAEYLEIKGKTGYATEYVRVIDQPEVRVADLSTPKGLVAWNLIEDATFYNRLICYWLSKGDYERDKIEWETALTGGYALNAAGSVLEVFSDKSTLKKKSVFLQNSVLTIAGLLAALTTIGNFWDLLFAYPHITYRPDEKGFSIIQGEPINLKVALVNQIQTPNKDVTVQAAVMHDHRQSAPSADTTLEALTISENSIPELTGGEKRDLTITGKTLAPGDYKINFVTHTTAGRLRFDKEFHHTEVLKVWPERPTTRFDLQKYRDTNFRVFMGEVDIGRAEDNGVNCALEIDKLGKFQYFGLDAPVLPSVPPEVSYNGERGNDVFLIRWTIRPVKSKQTMWVNIKLIPPDATDWKVVKQAASFECQYAKGGSQP
ncbi:hypothetical protein QCE63_26360 [Caballeronia sp. LZ065]|uniref:hypothetical protein n=1 Tax=Caballeronia sp. LZ065 TaxID=3038571 RepID=UPI002854AF17|nr:hypothetical protein [Caballeronia sp. LZ065]MDR5782935.1 hypothetical protein [Caballeronia sp. LZ065]